MARVRINFDSESINQYGNNDAFQSIISNNREKHAAQIHREIDWIERRWAFKYWDNRISFTLCQGAIYHHDTCAGSSLSNFVQKAKYHKKLHLFRTRSNCFVNRSTSWHGCTSRLPILFLSAYFQLLHAILRLLAKFDLIFHRWALVSRELSAFFRFKLWLWSAVQLSGLDCIDLSCPPCCVHVGWLPIRQPKGIRAR